MSAWNFLKRIFQGWFVCCSVINVHFVIKLLSFIFSFAPFEQCNFLRISNLSNLVNKFFCLLKTFLFCCVVFDTARLYYHFDNRLSSTFLFIFKTFLFCRVCSDATWLYYHFDKYLSIIFLIFYSYFCLVLYTKIILLHILIMFKGLLLHN